MSQMMFLNIATFVPSYLLEDDKGKLRDISVAEFSVVLAMYNTARLLLSTTIGKSMNKVGRKNFIIIGFILMIISTIGFGALDYIPVTPKETMKWVFFSGAIIWCCKRPWILRWTYTRPRSILRDQIEANLFSIRHPSRCLSCLYLFDAAREIEHRSDKVLGRTKKNR